VNSHLYHYAGNNPVKYTDPDGKFTIPWPLVAKALEFIIPAILSFLTTKALNDKKEYFDGNFDDSIIGAKDILDPSSVMDAAPKGLTVTESRRYHEKKTYGKIENEIKAELGRRLNSDESDRWHREMEKAKEKKVKSGEVPKGETNPSLSEEELRDAARDSLGVEL
jgi:hypothetical protein